MDVKMNFFEKFKRGQVTIFIIIAIIILAVVITFFAFRGGVGVTGIPSSFQPVYTSFVTCLENDVLTGIDVMESQAGYIYVPDFEPGSSEMPFSNQLDFLGNPVPYWYYVSGNNIQREQVPSKSLMEEQLGDFIEGQIRNCDLSTYYDEGYDIRLGEPSAKVSIRDSEVEVNLDMDMDFGFGDETALVDDHDFVISSNLGKLYDNAVRVYQKEQDELFLEEYALDTLNSYAPVDGVEITCSPKVWGADEIFDTLEVAIEENTRALNVVQDDEGYFSIDLPTDSGIDVRFLNSKKWAHGFEVNPSEGNVLISKPIGNQPGLGILGFCYVPYHYVYTVTYPVLIQVQESEGDEIFQFPVAVVIQGNQPRVALGGSAAEISEPELCRFKNTRVSVRTFDSNLVPVEAEISYGCFNEICQIGTTQGGRLNDNFPQCVNGFVVARADGFEDTKFLHTTTNPGSVDMILDRLYELEVDLTLDRQPYGKSAIVSFISDDLSKGSKSIVYPEQKTIELSQGQYEVQVNIFRDSTLNIGASVQEQCVKAPRSGLLGVVGFTAEKCFDIEVPATSVESALAGGGKQNYFILESELQGATRVKIDVDDFPAPTTLEQLQINYLLAENSGLDIQFI